MTQNQKITSQPRSLDFPPGCGKFVTWKTMENGAGDLLLPLSVREHPPEILNPCLPAQHPHKHGPRIRALDLLPFPLFLLLFPLISPLPRCVCILPAQQHCITHVWQQEAIGAGVGALCWGDVRSEAARDTARPFFPSRAICHVNSGLLSVPGPATRGALLPFTPPVCTD